MTAQRRRSRLGRARPVDRVPELTHYQDTGCVVFPSCLRCPLAVCIYDDPHGTRRAVRRGRDAEIARLFHGGWSAAALADRYGVSRRHVFRIVRRERDEG